jgi:hypothetical protein
VGVPLRHLATSPPTEPIDWDELADYAATLLPDDEARRSALDHQGDGVKDDGAELASAGQ